MEKTSKIYLAGHDGLVGSAIKKSLEQKGYSNILFRTKDELDLCNQSAVNNFFIEEKPEYVFIAAALVGGIVANNTYRADFLYTNLMIQNNIIYSAWKNGVKKLLFLGSTCIYPKEAPQPLKEEYLLTSELEYTNEPYAIAKIAGLKLCESFNKQYGTNFISVMPTNLYGPGDNFNLKRSHVMPALVRKIFLGRCLETNDWKSLRKDLHKNPIEKANDSSSEEEILKILSSHGVFINKTAVNDGKPKVSVEIWGTGQPLREFMYSQDMADACVFIMENTGVNEIVRLQNKTKPKLEHAPHFINIGTGEEITIKDLATKISKIIGFTGNLVFDSTKPDGTLRKVTDITILRKIGFNHKYSLDKGILAYVEDYKNVLH
jgi:GDP-L-fucose synthase